MKRPSDKSAGRGPGTLETLEEAVALLRGAPVSALAAYYLGGVPFGLGFLYFWADMTRSSLAYQDLPQEAFCLAVLFLWMKTWQSVMARILWLHLSGEGKKPWVPGRFLKTALTQAILQPWGFLALPVALVMLLPFASVYAFFQNVTVLGDDPEEGLKGLFQKSRKLARLWPRSNHLMIFCTAVFSLFIFLNWEAALYWGPLLLKQFLAIDTVFVHGFLGFFNTTFLAITCVLTYLCVDPLMKAAYTLRCFYGLSLESGEDLKSQLKTAAGWARTLGFVGFAALALMGAARGWAQTGVPVSSGVMTGSALKPLELDKAIQETLRGEEYQWHMPREKPKQAGAEKKGVMEKFLEGSIHAFVSGVRKIDQWMDEFGQWLSKHFAGHPDKENAEAVDKRVRTQTWDFQYLYVFLWVLLAAAACALALLVYRLWSRREKGAVLGQAVAPAPDIADERVTGNELPMDEWAAMARDLLRQGKFRLALRAFYLASLSCLARDKLLTLAKFKSTLDYERELNRRAHSLPGVVSAFMENGRRFDRGWYGEEAVTPEAVEAFASNHERIRSTVETASA